MLILRYYENLEKWKNHVTSCFPYREKCKILKKIGFSFENLGLNAA